MSFSFPSKFGFIFVNIIEEFSLLKIEVPLGEFFTNLGLGEKFAVFFRPKSYFRLLKVGESFCKIISFTFFVFIYNLSKFFDQRLSFLSWFFSYISLIDYSRSFELFWASTNSIYIFSVSSSDELFSFF